MHIKANFQLDKMSVQSNLSLRTPLSYGQFVHSLFLLSFQFSRRTRAEPLATQANSSFGHRNAKNHTSPTSIIRTPL